MRGVILRMFAMGTSNGNERALEWLQQWEDLINAADFEGARRLFSPDVVSFGTLVSFMTGLQELEIKQWRNVWPKIKDFKFADSKVFPAGGQMSAVVVTCRWQSKGLAPDGSWYDRKGRATLVLSDENGQFRCCHSHLSLDPGVPARQAPA